ncbi:ChrR family anti-sigma-E factor [uncultured Roseovarius sp.]|mgnify:FL=1|uniref:ChrR family anti-sigma-E factor n=1 Tax=uncultured Roseovarius sp. TaxID=293344 RepID=UPI000C464FAE|nr:transcriptional regulator [Roseovarius sp.]HAW46052.1 transcriptional regulator [Roseovarius sp.]|tara:strand:+ start:1414 stop:2064 length:651 start_codon:yes stop_codon:yes gene_type:complete
MTRNQITHHLTDALLMAYSAGTLPEAFNLTVATHLSLCDDCRARAAAFDTVGGAMIDGADTVELAQDSLAATMARIRASKPQHETPAPRAGLFPAPLRDYVGGDLDAVRWRPVGMGVKQAILPTSRAATARLLFIPAGAAVPDHGHRGTELTLVLQGAFCDEVARFGPGDIEVANEELNHTPVAEIGADCICLAATDAPLRFRSLMPRLAQPFLRI